MSIFKTAAIALVAIVTLSTTATAATDWEEQYRAKYGRSIQKEQPMKSVKQKDQSVKSANCAMACCKSCC